ncbi:hypothetical protein BH11ACT3_BH11ACT3_02750 [soil metagenome]
MSGRHAPALPRTWRRAPGQLQDRMLFVATLVAGTAALGMLFFGALILMPR